MKKCSRATEDFLIILLHILIDVKIVKNFKKYWKILKIQMSAENGEFFWIFFEML
jgi:hypothetical protein